MLSEFSAALRCAEAIHIDPWLQSRQLPGAAGVKRFRSVPPGPNLRTDGCTGAILKQQLQLKPNFLKAPCIQQLTVIQVLLYERSLLQLIKN